MIIVDSLLRDKLVKIVKKEDMIITFKIIIAKEIIKVISIYTSQVQVKEDTKNEVVKKF